MAYPFLFVPPAFFPAPYLLFLCMAESGEGSHRDDRGDDAPPFRVFFLRLWWGVGKSKRQEKGSFIFHEIPLWSSLYHKVGNGGVCVEDFLAPEGIVAKSPEDRLPCIGDRMEAPLLGDSGGRDRFDALHPFRHVFRYFSQEGRLLVSSSTHRGRREEGGPNGDHIDSHASLPSGQRHRFFSNYAALCPSLRLAGRLSFHRPASRMEAEMDVKRRIVQY